MNFLVYYVLKSTQSLAYFSTHPMFQTNTPFRTLVELDTIYGLKQNQGIELSELSLDKNMIVSTGGNLKLTDSISVPFQARFSLDEQSLGVNPWKLTYVDFDRRNILKIKVWWSQIARR